MKKLLKKGWLPILLLLYALYRRDRRKTRAIERMNYALDQANDHIFALTIESGNLLDQNIELITEVEHLNWEAIERSELTRAMCVLHASGFYQQVLFNPEAIILTTNLVRIYPHSEKN